MFLESTWLALFQYFSCMYTTEVAVLLRFNKAVGYILCISQGGWRRKNCICGIKLRFYISVISRVISLVLQPHENSMQITPCGIYLVSFMDIALYHTITIMEVYAPRETDPTLPEITQKILLNHIEFCLFVYFISLVQSLYNAFMTDWSILLIDIFVCYRRPCCVCVPAWWSSCWPYLPHPMGVNPCSSSGSACSSSLFRETSLSSQLSPQKRLGHAMWPLTLAWYSLLRFVHEYIMCT